jgi:pimeloyl-ACP methyl ester carboxylesterase
MNMMADAFGQPPPPTTAHPNPTPSDPQAPGVTAPTHLTVLVHGFVGQPGDLTYLQSSITKFGKGKVLAHTARCNLGKTHDGVRAGGERLAEEVRQLVAANPSLQGISFVGNSLGGEQLFLLAVHV